MHIEDNTRNVLISLQLKPNGEDVVVALINLNNDGSENLDTIEYVFCVQRRATNLAVERTTVRRDKGDHCSSGMKLCNDLTEEECTLYSLRVLYSFHIK